MKLELFLVMLVSHIVSNESLNVDVEPVYMDPIELPIYQDAIRNMTPNITDIQRETRIVGGEIAELGQFPYTVALHMRSPDGVFICGGALIKYDWVLTAAHCIFGFNRVQVTIGVVNRIVGPSVFNTVITNRRDLIVHPRYNPNTIANDIALIHLQAAPSSLLRHQFVDIIDLPTDADDRLNLTGLMATVSGFGQTGDGFPPSEVLRFVTVPIISNELCSRTFGIGIRPSNLCVDTTSGRSPCRGDSGGPLTTNIDGNRVAVVGIVSFGRVEGCSLGFPVAFARVTYFRSWIAATINTGCLMKAENLIVVSLGLAIKTILNCIM